MNWFNNNFAYRPNTATANTTTPGSTTIVTDTDTTDTGSNNGSTTSDNNTGWWANVWVNGTGWGNNGSIQVNSDAIGCGFNNGNTGWGNRSYESGRYYNYANQRQPYDDFLIRGFNPGYEQCAVVETRNRRRDVEQTIDSIGQVGFWGRGSGYPQNLYYPQNSYNV